MSSWLHLCLLDNRIQSENTETLDRIQIFIVIRNVNNLNTSWLTAIKAESLSRQMTIRQILLLTNLSNNWTASGTTICTFLADLRSSNYENWQQSNHWQHRRWQPSGVSAIHLVRNADLHRGRRSGAVHQKLRTDHDNIKSIVSGTSRLSSG